MNNLKPLLLFVFTLFLVVFWNFLSGQVVINEGSNMNYSTIADENGDFPDWIEILNTGSDTVNLFNYSLSDTPSNPAKWRFPYLKLAPGAYMTIFCSGKDRKPVSGFVTVSQTNDYTPFVGWNTHVFSTPFYWDGVSNILINTCSYNSTQYTSNSSFRQTATPFYSTVMSFMDGSDASCVASYGTKVYQRPNMKLNDVVVGTGQIQNSPTDYPAPYGNWYWAARHQMLILASELTQAGLAAGFIKSLSFDVVSTDPNTWYDYIDIHMKLVSISEIPSGFEPVDTNSFQHTNFKISENGEVVNLFSAEGAFLSTLYLDCEDLDVSNGRYPDGSSTTSLLWPATPSASNNSSTTFSDFLEKPVFSVQSGFYTSPFPVYITNPNSLPCSIHYTTDGSDPTNQSPIYNGEPLLINLSFVLKAKAFSPNQLPSKTTVTSYFFDINHQTPIMSVVTDETNLYGPDGIFDNWWFDWEKAAYVEYFDTAQNLIFSQRAGMQIDGGWGGARSNPQHSFRIELDDGVLGDGPVNYPVITSRPERTHYGKFYLRNGSNQYLILPYKEACQTAMMGKETNNYYSAWEPVSVYINGSYFGLYDLREKMDTEYFQVLDGADNDNIDILSQSAWYGGVLRPVEGSVEAFYDDFDLFAQLNPTDPGFWDNANQYFDLNWYTDYIIGESWMGNTDWPWNNIKIVRSDKTNFTWRFCLMDMELSILPNAWTDCYFDHIQYMMSYDQSNKFINIWQIGVQNVRFRNYFINRFADLMNTEYRIEKILALENEMFSKMVVEMPNEYSRWGDPNNIPGQMIGFGNNHNLFQQQLSQRTSQVRNHIQSNFNLANQVEVTLKVDPEEAGFIRISTVTPDTYPWLGTYFNGVPVKIEAFAKSPYTFINWSGNGLFSDTLNPVFQGMLNAETVIFEAHFENITGFDEYESLHVSVFPNPANDILNVSIQNLPNEELTYRISDIYGKTLHQSKLILSDRNHKISLKDINSGVYILEILSTSKKYSKVKFIRLVD
ncbi:MAG: hypothetical protein FD155_134 [Bacteroidetes bacterium]|nr:MAG: hypothetical protein FD155_134 [Bacteroidota bacterium]